jgi:TPP-dependent pyruvate/acetoin dehydrogenase alpha subunit
MMTGKTGHGVTLVRMDMVGTSVQADSDQVETLLGFYKSMVRIRFFEEAVETAILAGRMPGFCHLSIGQEAVPVGVSAALRPGDYVASNHRGHGHALAMGCDPKAMMAELFGRSAGLSGGRGGSMHMADVSKGFLGTDGIVGASLPLACGAALSALLRDSEQVAIAFLGDGASDIGTFSESLNLASLWLLPVVFVVENNLYSEGTSQVRHQRVDDIAERAAGYGLPSAVVDGMDVSAVATAAISAADRSRKHLGPSLVECKTYRYRGHYVGEPEGYRTAAEVEQYRELDPLQSLKRRLIAGHGVTEQVLGTIEADVRAEIDGAVAYGAAGMPPDPGEIERFTYV